ncbi:MAG TPA: class I SAM-dependent methyltransferase [Candidatus Paceibacterota bacterium]|jgi:ubiquinone/menaquinone biosynthesis C-methylase UbiE|nr:class I SAM-dependent methyltransferase [Candidatus Paceibacterota bacterium]
MSSGEHLSNEYAREYYDAQVGPLSSYEEQRWHTDPVREFEYNQTKRALSAALLGRTDGKALEIGPGDGVWTSLIREHVSGPMHLVEQSQEMLTRAQARLAALQGLTFERADFLASTPAAGNDLIVAVRCFEYFEDKEGALKKMRGLLSPGGRIVIITKNPQMITSVPAQSKTLHQGQVSRTQMRGLAAATGLRVVDIYPAILRLKATRAFMRSFFDVLHRAAVTTRGLLVVPFLNTYATESYVYVLCADTHGQN